MESAFRVLNFNPQDKEIRTFLEMKNDGDLITDPDYQRQFIYNQKQESKLIESILMGIPLPTIYLCEEEDGRCSVIDGQQRIMSCVGFLENKYCLKGLTYYKELEGKYFKDLTKELKSRIKNTSIRTIIILKDSADAKFEIFERLNRGAVSLVEQELRNCVYRGVYNDMINDLAKNNKNLPIMIKKPNNRMCYQEYILRFFALRNFLNYSSSMKNHLNKYMIDHQNDDSSAKKDKDMFNNTLSIVKQVLGDDAFNQVDYEKKVFLNKFSATFYDSIMIAFSTFNKVLLIQHADKIREAINAMKLYNDDYHNSCYAATGSKDRVINRILSIINLIKDILGSSSYSDEKRNFDSDLKKPLAEKQNYICPLCNNKILSLDDCEIDHVLPYSHGGTTTDDNAQLVHIVCNRHKSDHVSESIVNNETSLRLSTEKSFKSKKISSFMYKSKFYFVKSFHDMFAKFLNILKDSNIELLKKLAEDGYQLSNKTKAYITYDSKNIISPIEVIPGLFVESNLSSDDMIWFMRKLATEFNLKVDDFIINLKEDDE